MVRTWSKLGIAGQLYLLGAVVFLPIAALIGHNIYSDYQEAIAEASRNAFRHARSVAEQTERFHQQSFEILQGLARRPAIRAMSTAPCDTVFDHFLAANKSYANLLLDNADGDVICNAAKGPNLKGLVTQRPWFKSLMATGKRQVGDPTVGRVVGRWIAALAEPVVDDAGKVRGALVFTVDLWNYQFHLDRGFKESSFLVTILDSQGAVVARSREPDQWVGKKVQVPFEAIRSIKAGDTGFVRDVDDMEQLYGHASVPGTDWVVLVSSSKSVVSAEVWEHIKFELALAGSMIVLLFIAAFLVAKRIQEPIKAIAHAAEAVGDGRFDVRLSEAGGNRELSVLAQKFNRMAEQRSAAETRQAQAMADLAKSEERLQRALDASRLALWDYDLVSGEVYLSEIWSELLGGPHVPTTTTFEALAALTPAEDQFAIAAAMMSVIKGERQNYQVEHRVHKPDGEIIWVLSEGQVVERDVDGRALRAVGTNRNITERKRMEQALRASEAELRLITDNVPAIISYLDANLRYRFINQRFTETFGLRTQDVYGRHPREIFGDAAYHLIEGHVAKALNGSTVTFERSQILPSGEVGHFETRLIPHIAEHKTVDGCYALTLDITERDRAGARLRLAASVFDNAAEGILITDKDNNIVSVNRAFTEITGYSAQEAIGKNPRLLSSGRQAPAFYDEMWASIKANGRWWGEVWDRRKSGESYCESLSICAVRDERGEITNYCAVFADITQRKIAETKLVELNTELEARVAQRTVELERANKDLEAFSYSVSHDLRAPLRAISGFTAIVLQQSTLDAESVNMLQRIGSAGERMGRIIDDLLSLARVSRQPLHRENLDLSALAGEVVDALVQAHPERSVNVAVTPGMHIDADPGLARIVLENLIGNAWKFTSRTGAARIEVGCEERAGETVYFVRDNGAGFDMKYAEKLFRPFQRLHGAKEFEGTGIGLSIVQRIVARHEGRVWAEGEVGRGASLQFTVGDAGHSRQTPA